MIKNKCKICKKILSKKKYQYCLSCACKIRYKNHPERNPMYEKHLSQKSKNAISKANFKCGKPKCKCGKELSHYHTKLCWNCEVKRRKIPQNNPRWLGGIAQHPYTYEFNIILKESIRKRDHYKCQLCSKKGKYIHHIDYNKVNCNKNNLITLCLKCNSKVNANRDYWFTYFTYIMG